MKNKKNNFEELFYSDNYINKKESNDKKNYNNAKNIIEISDEYKKDFIESNKILLIILFIVIVLGISAIIYININDIEKETANKININYTILNAEDVLSTNNEIEEIKVTEKKPINLNANETADIRLVQIADLFNNSTYPKFLESKGYTTTKATVQENKITMSINRYLENYKVELIEKNNVLSTEIIHNKNMNDTSTRTILAIMIGDCVGQLKGHEEGKLYRAFANENSSNYTIEKEGIEFKEIANGVSIKINLNSDFSFLNDLDI